MRNTITPYVSLSQEGRRSARSAYGRAGVGSRKKRRPRCNGADTRRLAIEPMLDSERRQTSDRCSMARESLEPGKRGKANDGAGRASASRRLVRPRRSKERIPAEGAYRQGRFTKETVVIFRETAGLQGLTEGLSRMNRKVHVRFLGGKGAARPLTYPACARQGALTWG